MSRTMEADYAAWSGGRPEPAFAAFDFENGLQAYRDWLAKAGEEASQQRQLLASGEGEESCIRIAGPWPSDGGLQPLGGAVEEPLKALRVGRLHLVEQPLSDPPSREGPSLPSVAAGHSSPSQLAPTKPLVDVSAKRGGRLARYLTRQANVGDALVWLVALPVAVATLTALILGA